ncbi:hypothetical protein GCM10008927_20880 [Amylibacter ulvae]|uniref:Uncharacterized protein n=1 Tax=Paramylibacter ulvae TaxID=1651968 RepID=A0ABQ3D3M7_9RHOB|nr:hypothetical protein [Amylibacter ulvae]GHA54881.1 hypothetical protein GCM10008927_20880 [Amylibacter ulvae]
MKNPIRGLFTTLLMSLPASAMAGQDGPACELMRAADFGPMLAEPIGYNSATFGKGDLRISNCNAIGNNGGVISLRMYSFNKKPNTRGDALGDILLDAYDPNIPFLQGYPITDTSVYYAAEGDLIFWSKDFATMYIIDEAPKDRSKTIRAARMLARHLGLEKKEVQEITIQ